MTDTRKAQLEIGVNAGPAEEGFKRVERAGKGMADAVGKSADTAGKAVGGIGGGADKGAQKLDKATSSIIASVQRTTAAMQAGEKGTAKYFEQLANQRGVNADVLKPYLDGLRAVEKAQGQVGMSAKATAAAMRGVPAQFTDIIVSLQGGQAPLTVLLQQGGQLKDVFGGVGNAARALGGYVAGLVNPFTVAAAAVGTLGFAYLQGAKEAEAYNRALILSGNAVGTTAGQLQQMARGIAGVSGTQGAAAEALAVFAQSAGVARGNLEEFTGAASRFARVSGQAVGEVAKQFADLAKDPLQGSLKLNESMNYLTESVYGQIKALQERGKTIEAADLAQKSFSDTLNDRAKSMEQNLGTLERGWNAVTKAIKGTWDAIKDVGRPVGPEQELERVQAAVKRVSDRRASVGDDSAFAPALEKELALLRDQESVLQSTVRELQKGTSLRATEADRVKARAQADKDGLKYLTDAQRLEQDIAQQRATLVRAGASQLEIEQRIAQIRASYDKKTPTASTASTGGESELASLRARTVEAERYLASLKAQGLEADKLTEGERAALRLREELKGTLTAQVRASKEASLAEAERLGTVQRLIASEKDQAEQTKRNAADTAKFFDDSIKAQAAAVNAADKSIEATKKQAAAEREAMASIGLTKEAIAELTVAKYEDAAASKERMANIMAEAGEPELLIQKYREEAKALRDLAKAKRERGAAETAQDLEDASQKAAEKAATDWQRASDRIEDSITNALMRGFESGKGFAQTLKDTLVNMFKTMVLRPVIQAVVGGVGGLSGAAASAGGGGGSALSGASSLLGLSGTMSTFGSYMATGFMNTVAGSGFAASMGAAGGLASSGAVAGGAGMAVGAAIPYVAAALAVANVLGLMRSNRTVGGGLMGTLGEGDIQAYDLNRRGGSLLSGPSYSIQNVRESDQSKAIQDAFVAMRSATAGMATQLGLANDSIIGFTTQLGKDLIHPDTGGYGIKLDGLNPEQAAAKVQEALATANEEMARQLLGTFEATTEKYMREVELYFDSESGAAVMGREEATRQGADRWVAGEFVREGETAAQALQRLAGSLTAVNNVLGTLDQSLMATSLAGGDAASKLIDAFGGLENFTASTASYYQNFYTETERNAKTTEQLTKSLSGLGLAMPDTIKGFRDLVGAQDLTTDAGRATYAALISLSPAFAQVTNAADAAALAIVNQRQGLQDQLDGLLGNTTALRERERNALDESNRALYDNIKALEDQATAAQAAAAIASERSGLQNQLDTLLGNTAALRERERNGLDESNRALYDKIKALEDQKAADAIAAQAAAEAQRAQEQAAAEAQRAQQQAAAEAQRAAEQIKSAWQSIGDSIVSEINRIRGEVAGNTPTSFASAQAQFAIASAQARGGDQEAAKLLPTLSKTLLDMAAQSATSAVELQRLQGQTAGSLAATLAIINRQYGTTTSASLNVQDLAALSLVPVLQGDAAQPQLAAVPTDQLGVAPTLDQPSLFGGLVAEIQALRAQVAALQVAADSTADSTRKTKDLIQLVTRDGEAMQTEAAT